MIGAIAEEVSQRMGIRIQSASARMSELKQRDMIEQVRDKEGRKVKRSTSSGKGAGVFIATTWGLKVLASSEPLRGWDDVCRNNHGGEEHSEEAFDTSDFSAQRKAVLRYIAQNTPRPTK